MPVAVANQVEVMVDNLLLYAENSQKLKNFARIQAFRADAVL